MQPHRGSHPYHPLPQSHPVMADGLHGTVTPSNNYTPNHYYALQTHPEAPRIVTVAPSALHQNLATQRKRAKFTRSKTGCLTCRTKKIKCDETKPKCVRCSHSQRDCTWPECVLPPQRSTRRQKPLSHVDDTEIRSSTAGSSGVSDTPQTCCPTPQRRGELIELGIPPMVTRSHSDSNVNVPIAANDARHPGAVPASTLPQGCSVRSNNGRALPAIPEVAASYANQPQNIHIYPSHHCSQSYSTPELHARGTGIASQDSQWSCPQLQSTVNLHISPSVPLYRPPIDSDRHIPSRFPTLGEKELAASSSSHAIHPVRH